MNLRLLKRLCCRVILPHLTIVLSGMLIVLLAIDRVNSAMMFIDHRITKGLMLVLCIASILNGAQLLTRPQKDHVSHAAESPSSARRERPRSGKIWM